MALEKELTALLNKHSAENASDTPDFILAAFLTASLEAFNVATRERDRWFGREKLIAVAAAVPVPEDPQ